MKISRRQLRKMIMEQSKVAPSPYKKANDLLRKAGNEYGTVGHNSEFYSDLGSLVLSILEMIDLTYDNAMGDGMDYPDNDAAEMVADMARKVEKYVEESYSDPVAHGPQSQDMP